MSVIRRTFKIGGIATDMTTVKLSDPTGTYGVKRNDTNAVVVADNTAMTNMGTGIYEYTFTDPADDLVYTYYLEFVYLGVTYRVMDTLTGPVTSDEPLTLSEAKAHLRVDLSTDDTLITALIKAAREDCEDFQNRTYISRSRELWLDSFPCDDEIEIPYPPLVSVQSVKRYDTANAETSDTTLTDYYVDTRSEPGRLCLAYGKSWPSAITLRPNNGIKITYTAGYGVAADVPQAVKQAMLLLIADFYAVREAGKASESTVQAVERLLWKNRIM